MAMPRVVLLDFDDTLFDNGFVPASVEDTCVAVAASAQVDAGRLLAALGPISTSGRSKRSPDS